MARLEQITRASYVVEAIWECEFDEGIMAKHPELEEHPMMEHSPLNTRDALYGVERRPCVFTIRYGMAKPFVM
jgi:hypothetical protein